MSLDELSDALEGGKPGRGHYEPAPSTYDPYLVHELVERCQHIFLGSHQETKDFIRTKVQEQIERIECFDQNAFLDSLICAWLKLPKSPNICYLLDESMRALYEGGVTSFTPDLTPHGDNMYHLFSNIAASEERWIEADCVGSFERFAFRTEYCDLTLRGSVQVFGEGVKHSQLRFEGKPGEINTAASDAQDSAFYLPSMDCMPFIWRRHSGGCGDGDMSYSHYHSCSGCEFYIRDIDERRIASLETNGFWRYGNRLFRPGADGGWEEVKPE